MDSNFRTGLGGSGVASADTGLLSPNLVHPLTDRRFGAGLFHRTVIDLPRRYFRGDPKFRDEYHLTFSDAGIEFQTLNMSSMIAWSFYTGVIENDKFYLMKYGNNIHSVSMIPKRAFADSRQESTFRQMLRRNLDPKLKLSAAERENQEYVPKNLQPPDWR